MEISSDYRSRFLKYPCEDCPIIKHALKEMDQARTLSEVGRKQLEVADLTDTLGPATNCDGPILVEELKEDELRNERTYYTVRLCGSLALRESSSYQTTYVQRIVTGIK